MDWVTFTREQVDANSLPSVCIVCGEHATDCVNKTFSHTPDWVQYLYFAGFFPGMIAEHFWTKEMRVSCPVCPKHRTHWSKLVWFASAGWLLALPLALLGLALGAVMFPVADPRTVGLVAAGAIIGLIIWITIVIRLAVTWVKVSRISNTGDEITFERVSDAFATAAVETKMPPPSW
jgi:hypothetical protein